MKEKILMAADGLFTRYGVKSVTMDDMARELAISKKTIYQYYRDKNEIVKEFTLRQCQKRGDDFGRIPEEAEDAVKALILISKCIRESIVDLNPSLLYDIQKYYNDAWQIFLEFKENTFKKSIEDTIKKGIEEGLFRAEINIEILTVMRMEQVQSIFDPRIFPRDKFSFKEVQMQLLDHFIHGLLTIEGKKLLDEYLKNHQDETIL